MAIPASTSSVVPNVTSVPVDPVPTSVLSPSVLAPPMTRTKTTLIENWQNIQETLKTQENLFYEIIKGDISRETFGLLNGIEKRVVTVIGCLTTLKKDIDIAKKSIKKTCCHCIPTLGVDMKRLILLTIVGAVITIAATSLSAVLSNSNAITVVVTIVSIVCGAAISLYTAHIGSNNQNQSNLESIKVTEIKDAKKLLALIRTIKRLIKVIENKNSPHAPEDSNRRRGSRISNSPNLAIRTISDNNLPDSNINDSILPAPAKIAPPMQLPPAAVSVFVNPLPPERKIQESDPQHEIEQENEQPLSEMYVPPEELITLALTHYKDLQEEKEELDLAIPTAIVNLGMQAATDVQLIRPLSTLEALADRIDTASNPNVTNTPLPQATNYTDATAIPDLVGDSSGPNRVSPTSFQRIKNQYQDLFSEHQGRIQERFGVRLNTFASPGGYWLESGGIIKKSSNHSPAPETPHLRQAPSQVIASIGPAPLTASQARHITSLSSTPTLTIHPENNNTVVIDITTRLSLTPIGQNGVTPTTNGSNNPPSDVPID